MSQLRLPRGSLSTIASSLFFGLTAILGDEWARTGAGLAVTCTAAVTTAVLSFSRLPTGGPNITIGNEATRVVRPA